MARRLRFPTLTRELNVDVAVVGGGITGAALAWRFADAGIRVALVEAARIGRGSTAASTALLMQEPDDGSGGAVPQRYGRPRARRIWQLSLAATRDFIATLTRLRIECDLVRRDSIYYATEQRRRQPAARRAPPADSGGLDARWLEGAALRRALGFDAAGRRSGPAATPRPIRSKRVSA